MAGRIGALYLVTLHWPWQGTNVFLGSVVRTRGRKEISFSFADLEPDGCLVADQLASATSTFENPGAGDQKVQIRLWVLFLQKLILFCDGEVFFIDRGLLMGASIWKYSLIKWKPIYCGQPKCRVSDDIIWQKPNISQLVINWDDQQSGCVCDMKGLSSKNQLCK